MKILKDKPKIKGLNICNDCGIEFKPPLSKNLLTYQRKHMDNDYIRLSCDSCINSHHTLKGNELKRVVKHISS